MSVTHESRTISPLQHGDMQSTLIPHQHTMHKYRSILKISQVCNVCELRRLWPYSMLKCKDCSFSCHKKCLAQMVQTNLVEMVPETDENIRSAVERKSPPALDERPNNATSLIQTAESNSCSTVSLRVRSSADRWRKPHLTSCDGLKQRCRLADRTSDELQCAAVDRKATDGNREYHYLGYGVLSSAARLMFGEDSSRVPQQGATACLYKSIYCPFRCLHLFVHDVPGPYRNLPGTVRHIRKYTPFNFRRRVQLAMLAEMEKNTPPVKRDNGKTNAVASAKGDCDHKFLVQRLRARRIVSSSYRQRIIESFGQANRRIVVSEI